MRCLDALHDRELRRIKITFQDVCIVQSYKACSAAVLSLWKSDACPIYIAMMTIQDEIYNNAH